MPVTGQAFYAGRFSVDGKENLPCLVYVDFRGQLWLYYNVGLPFLRGVDFITALKDDAEVQKYFKDNDIDTYEVGVLTSTVECGYGKLWLFCSKMHAHYDMEINEYYKMA